MKNVKLTVMQFPEKRLRKWSEQLSLSKSKYGQVQWSKLRVWSFFLQGPMLLKKLVTLQSLTVTFRSFDCPSANVTTAMWSKLLLDLRSGSWEEVFLPGISAGAVRDVERERLFRWPPPLILSFVYDGVSLSVPSLDLTERSSCWMTVSRSQILSVDSSIL